jgi:hypothetical protein
MFSHSLSETRDDTPLGGFVFALLAFAPIVGIMPGLLAVAICAARRAQAATPRGHRLSSPA